MSAARHGIKLSVGSHPVSEPTPPIDQFGSEFFYHLAELGSDVITVMQPDGKIVYNNQALERTFGWSSSELEGEPVMDYIHEADQAHVAEAIESLATGAAEFSEAHFRFRHINGSYVHMEATGRIWQHASGPLLLVHSRDVTEQFQALTSLAQSNELLSKMFAASNTLFSISLAESGEFVEVNDAWCQISGYSREEAIGRSAIDLGIWGPTSNRAKVITDLQNADSGLDNYEMTTYSRDGEPRHLLADIKTLELNGQQQILISALDITHGKLVEDELRQSQKMEAIGQLTGGVAHDFNNLIGVTMGNAELLLHQMSQDSDLRHYAQHILDASHRAAELTKQLLAFSRRQNLAPEPVNVHESLQSMLPLLQTTLGENTEIKIDCEADLWYCSVDPTQLESAILNLTLNAKDAMPNGGVASFHARNRHLDGTVELVVKDTGGGIDPEVRSRIFDPFFTTKNVGKGTGLGLSMVFGFVTQSGGRITFDSTVGEGTAFCMYFPKCDPPVEPANDPANADQRPAPTGHSHALVIEDNEPLRELVSEFLTQLGYNVVQSSGEADIKLALAQIPAVDLVVTDVVLKGTTRGTSLAEDIKAQNPNTKVLVITGYAEESATASADLLLLKPFSRSEFDAAIESLRG